VVRALGGVFFLSGILTMVFNVVMTVRTAKVEQAAIEARIAAKMAGAGA
jgi:cytochrome c oxidase cbb3-type subunit I